MCIQYQCTQFHQTHTKGLKAHIDCNTVVLGDINAPLSPIDRSSKKKINKEMLVLNDTRGQMNQLISTQYFIQKQHNIHSSQQTMELSPKLTISWDTKQASANIRK
jgi:exonuclease III